MTLPPLRVLYSFPHRLGADRICYTAWQQVNGLAAAGASVQVMSASVQRPLPSSVAASDTLSAGGLRLPFRLLGSRRAFALHDHIVARRLRALAGQIDIVHTWPLGALRTLAAAQQLGIPTALERPNAHTRFAYEAVRTECQRINVPLPPDHEHAFNEDILRIEEEEYRRAFRLLCPSDFVVETFVQQGFSRDVLSRHFYGYDEGVYRPQEQTTPSRRGLTALFVGVCAVRKGLHFALEAWLASPACHDGSFLIAGEFLPTYRASLARMLSHPSVEVLGHRKDIPELMRQSDVLLLPSIEEGFGLVCTEAMGSGCVPLVSDACTELCQHRENAMVHHVGDVAALTEHLRLLHEDRALLHALRRNGLELSPQITWTAAGVRLMQVYQDAITAFRAEAQARPVEQLRASP